MRGHLFLHGDGSTQRDLLADAHRIAARLAGAGRVVLSCADVRAFVPGLLGAWLAGATIELLPNVQPDTLDRVDADPAIAFVLHDAADRRDRAAKAVYVPGVLAEGGAAPVPTAELPHVAVRMTTSGTTARPTYVEKTLAQLVGEVDVLARVFAPATAVVSTVPPSHLYGLLFGVLLPLRLGARIVAHTALLPADVAAVLGREAADLLVSTPAHLRAMASADMPRDLRVISSGAQLPAELQLRLAEVHGWHVTDVLGSTETGGVATRSDPAHGWTPLPGVEVELADERLAVRSPWCAGVTLDDRAELRADGTFAYLGRERELVKIAGKRAEAAAIEAAVLALPEIADAAVAVYGAGDKEPRLHLAVVAREPAPARDALRAAITDAVRRQFDAVFVPRAVEVIAAIPRTERGKIDPEALRALFATRATTAVIPLRRVDDNAFAADIPANLVFFRGHFDGHPILPGGAIVERLVWPAVRLDLPAARLRALHRLRFRRPILPGQRVTVNLRHAPGRVWFDVVGEAGALASGQLVVE